MHAAKMTVYGHFIPFDVHAWRIAALLSLGMIVGSWIGKKTVERFSVEKLRLVVGALLIVLALQMIISG